MCFGDDLFGSWRGSYQFCIESRQIWSLTHRCAASLWLAVHAYRSTSCGLRPQTTWPHSAGKSETYRAPVIDPSTASCLGLLLFGVRWPVTALYSRRPVVALLTWESTAIGCDRSQPAKAVTGHRTPKSWPCAYAIIRRPERILMRHEQVHR